MRNKLVAMIILLIGLSLLTIGIIEGQFNLINQIYNQMAVIPQKSNFPFLTVVAVALSRNPFF